MRYNDETKLSELKVKDLKEIIHNELNKREYKETSNYIPMYMYLDKIRTDFATNPIYCQGNIKKLENTVEEIQCKKKEN